MSPLEPQPRVALIDERVRRLVPVDEVVVVPAEQPEPGEVGLPAGPPRVEMVHVAGPWRCRAPVVTTVPIPLDDRTGLGW